MGLLARLKNAAMALGGAPVNRWEQTDVDPSNMWVSMSGMGGGGTPRDTKKWILAYRRNPRVRAAVTRIAKDVAKTELCLLRDGRDGKPKEVLKHPFLDFIKNPWITGGGGSWSTLAESKESYGMLDGNAFWLWRKDPGAVTPLEAWPIPPHWISKLPTRDDPEYWLHMPYQEIPERVPESEVTWFREIDLLNPFGRGLGLCPALDDEVSQEEFAAKYNNAMFRSGGRPDLLISVGQSDPKVPVDTKRLEAIKKDWEARHSGFWNAFKAAFLTGDVRVQTLGQSHREMEFIEGRKFNRDVIFQTFGLPPEVMGVVENSNRATAEAALYLYSLQVVLPRLISFVWDLNRLVVPMWDTKVYLGFENPVQETEEFKLNKAVELFKAGALTRDECRETTGYDPVGDERGDEFLQPSNTITITQGGGSQGKPEADKPEKPAPTDKKQYRTLYVPTKFNNFKRVRIPVEKEGDYAA